MMGGGGLRQETPARHPPGSRKDHLNLGRVAGIGSRKIMWSTTFPLKLNQKRGYLPFISPATGSSGRGVEIGKMGIPRKIIFKKIQRLSRQ